MEALDALAAKAGKAAKDDLKKVVDELEVAAGKLEGEAKENGAIYVKVAKKALEKVRGWEGGAGFGVCFGVWRGGLRGLISGFGGGVPASVCASSSSGAGFEAWPGRRWFSWREWDVWRVVWG